MRVLLIRLVIGVLAALSLGVPLPAHADRFGPPWMDRVTVDRTTLYADPDRSQPIGPLGKDALLIVLGQQGEMVQVRDGWVPVSDVHETVEPWVAEVSVPSASVYAFPEATSEVRRTAHQGNLLRVMGVAQGVGQDQNLWWSTTEGYVSLDTVQRATGDWATEWTMPSADEALRGWWAQAREANVRAGPTTDAPVVGSFGGGEHLKVLAEVEGEKVSGNGTWARIDGGRYAGAYIHSSRLARLAEPKPVVASPPVEVGDKPWILVDRPSHTLTLLRDGQPQFATYVSLGRAGKDTPAGDYTTWGKHVAERMSSAANPEADHAYNLPNVPFIQYYKDGGYAIHGTYWHDVFGTDESQGCINLTWTDAAYLFGQTLPQASLDPTDQSAAGAPIGATPVLIRGA